ncbi:MAG: SEC-C domain-containing protein [Patescibacteria group bacterium]|nr:SEC-C domain-containing protein [Patescibacteria group bacterium]
MALRGLLPLVSVLAVRRLRRGLYPDGISGAGGIDQPDVRRVEVWAVTDITLPPGTNGPTRGTVYVIAPTQPPFSPFATGVIHNPLPLPVDYGILGEKKPPPFILRRIGPRIGRNDPCPCGSGEKFKRCCWRRER